VWTSSSIDGLVTARDPGGFAPAQITGISQPFEIAITPYDGSAWICDLAGSLAHYDGNGFPVSPAQIPLLDLPIGVAVDPRDFSIWVCESGGSRVRHFTLNGNAIATAYLPRPSRVAVDSLTEVAWVTSSGTGRIWRIAPGGAVLDSLAVASAPLGIAIDRGHGRVWVTDAAADRVLAIDINTRAVLFSVPGIAEPRGVAVDAASGDAWVVARVAGAVYRISKDGVVLERCDGFSDPYEIGLDPGQ
jgi:YVTN family beta-propeller protein